MKKKNIKQIQIDESEEARVRRLLPKSQDLTLVVLKGHLLVEEMLEKLIEENFREPNHFKDARFTFLQKCRLAQAILGGEPSVWNNVLTLNKIRNRFAHDLEPKNMQKLIDDWISINSDENATAVSTDKERARAIKEIVSYTCGMILGVRDVLSFVNADKEAAWNARLKRRISRQRKTDA
ncbi:MAG TPA: hypothetical protein V6C97_12870 [Oculatellaceae cyanobacterium]